MEAKWENGALVMGDLPDPVLQMGVEEPLAVRGGPMVSKILGCELCGADPLILERRMFQSHPPLTYEIRCVHPSPTDPEIPMTVQTAERPELFLAINEWNRMQMQKGGE
jgi:hypothetical protein